MSHSELTSKSIEDLNLLLQDTSNSLFRMKMQNYSNQLRDTSQVRKLRRTIARIQTVLSVKKKTV